MPQKGTMNIDRIINELRKINEPNIRDETQNDGGNNMQLIIKFYDVEHGSCTHIITPNNKHILVDIGSKTDKSLVRFIKGKYFPNGGTIDELIITHPHEDHIWDIPAMYKYGLKPLTLNRPKEAFDIVPQIDTQSHVDIANYANKINSEYNVPVPQNENPLDKNVNGGVDIDIFPAPQSKQTKEDLNTYSYIIVVRFQSFKFILTGDNPASILKYMIEQNQNDFKNTISNATVLLAPHHGRSGDFCKEFFDLVNPRLSVISDKEIVHETQENSSYVYRGTGVEWSGNNRYVFSTRYDGTIFFSLRPDSSWSIGTSTTEY